MTSQNPADPATPGRGLRFGLDISTSAAPGTDPVADAVHAERLGFDFISAADHPEGVEPSYEVWTMLTWLAAATSRIGIATRVLGVPYRPPAMTAKMAETLNRLAGGRLILGLGGGAADEEFRAFGLTVPTAREKVDGLEEAIRITRGLWQEPNFSHDGQHYRVDRANLEPKPERPIPIWLGTFGPRALAVTGRLADGWIPSLHFAQPDQIVSMRRRVMDAAAAAGRSSSAITCAYNLFIRIDEKGNDDGSRVIGGPEYVIERLASFVALGFDVLNFRLIGPGQVDQAERLAREVLPALQKLA